MRCRVSVLGVKLSKPQTARYMETLHGMSLLTAMQDLPMRSQSAVMQFSPVSCALWW